MEWRKRVALLAGIVGVGLGGGLGYYLYYTAHYVRSDAVFVKSDSLRFLSFKLPGKIETLYKQEGEPVKEGEVIGKLETHRLEEELKGVKAEIEGAEAQLRGLKLEKGKLERELKLREQLLELKKEELEEGIAGKRAGVESASVKLQFLERNYRRFKRLEKEGKVAREKFEEIESNYLGLKYQIEGLKREIKRMEAQLKEIGVQQKLLQNQWKEVERLGALIAGTEEKIEGLKAKKGVLEQQLSDSYLRSPIDGVIAKRFRNQGEVVGAGTQIVAVVNPRDLYLLDLLEDRKIEGVKVGAPVKIWIDGVPGEFEGVVEKILPVSAATFAILPRDFSSGEFTKLAQRFYLRIKFKTPPPPTVLVGMGGEVEIQKE
ncbi:MAG: HlyD family efflux transporter periplasmic adaptor subunit [Campylobacterales bacterium]